MSGRPAARKGVHEPQIYRDNRPFLAEEKLNVQPERRLRASRKGGCGPASEAASSAAGAQQDGTLPPAARVLRSRTAPARVETLMRRIPCGTAPAVSGQLPAGVRKMVAPAARAPAIFCWMPPIGLTAPLAAISPVPAMNLPSVRSPGVSLSMMARANIRPALGPPISPTLILTWNGNR